MRWITERVFKRITGVFWCPKTAELCLCLFFSFSSCSKVFDLPPELYAEDFSGLTHLAPEYTPSEPLPSPH